MLNSLEILSLPKSCCIFLLTMSYAAAIDFEKMRSRELRKHLLKLGLNRGELAGILDRKELKRLAEEFYTQRKSFDADIVYRAKGVQFSIACIVIASIFIFWGQISAFFAAIYSGFKSWFDGFVYQIKERFRLISMGVVNRFPLSCITLLLATLIQIMQPMIQLSVLASWVIPTTSPFRRFLFPMPSFPITINHFLGNKEGRSSKSTSSIGDIGSMGVNIAPMVLIWVCNYLKHRLEEFGASRLISIVEAKQKRRDDREAVRRFKSKLNANNEDLVMDYADEFKDGPGMDSGKASGNGYYEEEPRIKMQQRAPVGSSPFEQEKGNLKSAFFQHVRSGTKIELEDTGVDDGDYWLSDSGSENSPDNK